MCERERERILMTAVWQHLRFIAVYMKRRWKYCFFKIESETWLVLRQRPISLIHQSAQSRIALDFYDIYLFANEKPSHQVQSDRANVCPISNVGEYLFILRLHWWDQRRVEWSQRALREMEVGRGGGGLSQQSPLSNGPFKCLRARLAALFSMPLRRSSAVKRVPVQTAPATAAAAIWSSLPLLARSLSPKSFNHIIYRIHISGADGLRGACIHTISKLLLPLGGVAFAPMPTLLFICDHQRASWLQHVCLCVRPTPTQLDSAFLAPCGFLLI